MPLLANIRKDLPGGAAPARSATSTVDSLDGIGNIEAQWRKLAAAPANPFVDFDYQYSWAAGLDPDQKHHVVLSSRGGEISGIAPLAENRKAGILTLIAAEMYEMQDLLYSPEGVRDLARALGRAGKPVFLKRISARSPLVAELESGAGRCFSRIKPVPGSPYLNLENQGRDPEANLNSGRRSDFRRMRRLAAAMGKVNVELHHARPETVGALLETVFRVEAAGWKGAERSALQFDPQRSEFFRRLSLRAATDGRLLVFFYRIGEAYAAAQLAVEYDNRFWLLRAGYDEKFSRCSPGMLLTAESLRFAAERGMRTYEFCGSVEPWTSIWTREEHPACSVFLCPYQIGSLAATVREFVR